MLHAIYETPLEFLPDARVHYETLGGNAGLAVVDEASLNRHWHGLLEIGARHHDEGVAASELQHRLLDLFAGLAGHLASRRFAARQGHCFDAWIIDHALNCARPDQQGLK